MKYAIRFFNNSTSLKQADEIIIKYNDKTVKLIDYVKNNKDKRIIADITRLDKPEDNLDIFAAAAKENTKFSIMLGRIQSYILPDLDEMNIKYFFIEGAGTWDSLMAQIQLGVSDIYIINELGFDIVRASKVCHDNNVIVRVFPNVAQSSASSFNNLDTFKFFFIRPEDIDLYSDYVDVCEFFGTIGKQDVLWKIYRDKKWADSLNYLILGLKLDINGNMIAPGWAERRLTCNKKCCYSHCKICENIESLGEAMRENGYEFKDENVDNEHTIIKEYLSNEPKSITWYDDKISEEQISEDYSK